MKHYFAIVGMYRDHLPSRLLSPIELGLIVTVLRAFIWKIGDRSKMHSCISRGHGLVGTVFAHILPCSIESYLWVLYPPLNSPEELHMYLTFEYRIQVSGI